ncbi:MAG: hypothetical protein K9J37_21800 [Saprospiraceae bacterium]|nr:hypothetical protein [Saprospiraceae bacterium]MCF8252556.1 hypothetical protein [Saprospiraceae bacterium]MCF8282597.1 transposase [Bacteroidales bacterium]MCF8314156.1 hypothetical protein [Saprospiraceae bacterium]MCF8442908.1 hypothetical protein [Saprospiraceae bacterium]
MRKYNPAIHHRRTIRLKGYDYSQCGAYFVTICAQDRRSMFGEIINHEMYLNEYGIIVYQIWEELPNRWQHIDLAAFQIMPNHMHGILIINDIPNIEAVDLNDTKVAWAIKPTLGNIVGAYCSIAQNECLKLWKEEYPQEYMGKVFQRNYHEHIIRNEKSFDLISNYIINNPANWNADKFFAP